MRKILVIGATGNVGREIVAQLSDYDIHVRAIVRSPESAGLRENVELVQGDLTVRHVVFLSNLTVRDDAEDQGYIATALHAKIERLTKNKTAGPAAEEGSAEPGRVPLTRCNGNFELNR